MSTFAKNDNIQIILTETQDIPFVIAAENKTENAQYIGQWSAEQHTNALNDPDMRHLLIQDIPGNRVGYIIIRGLTNPNKSIELMRIVITSKGLGHGKSALSLIKKWCFEEHKAHRLWLDVQEDNPKAQHIYKAQGFQHEGILRECVRAGESYKSLLIMSILAAGV